jgi:hypothetical protein
MECTFFSILTILHKTQLRAAKVWQRIQPKRALLKFQVDSVMNKRKKIESSL